jgi:hypothetical protein
MRRLALILAGLWAGSLLTICFVVAPTLFASLNDRGLAGQLAGRFFRLETWIGLALAAALGATVIAERRPKSPGADLTLIGVSAGAPLVSELALRPGMDAARSAGDMARFGMLHGGSTVLFAIACVGAFALVWRFSRPAE